MTESYTTLSIVAAQLEASNYTKGAKEVDAANAAMAASIGRVYESQETLQKGTQRTKSNFERLVAQMDGNIRAQQTFEKNMRTMTAALDKVEGASARYATTLFRQRDLLLAAEVAESTRATTLDNLRAKYIPLAAAEQAHGRALSEIAILEREGVATVQQITAARTASLTTLNAVRASLDEEANAQRRANEAKREARGAIIPLIAAQQAYSASSRQVTEARKAQHLTEEEFIAARARIHQSHIEAIDAIDQAKIATAGYQTTNERMQASYIPLVAAQQRYEKSLREIAAAATMYKWSAEQVNAANLEAKRVLDATSATHTTAIRGVGKFGQTMQSAGFQAQDFAVQLAGGQNALLALGQQGSQFLGMFGPGGAIAGAVLAVGALVLMFAKGGTEAERLKKITEQIGDHYADMSKRAEDYRTGLDDEARKLEVLALRYRDLSEAQAGSERIRLISQQRDLDKSGKELQERIVNEGIQTVNPRNVMMVGQIPESVKRAEEILREFGRTGELTRESFARLTTELNALNGGINSGNKRIKEMIEFLLKLEADVVNVEEKKKILAATAELLAGNVEAAKRAMGALGSTILEQISPIDLLNQKLAESVSKLAAFQAGGTGGLRAVEREIAIKTQVEATRRQLLQEAARTNTPDGARAAVDAQMPGVIDTITRTYDSGRSLSNEQTIATAQTAAQRAATLRRLSPDRRAVETARFGAMDEAASAGMNEAQTKLLVDARVAAVIRDETKARRDNTLVANEQADAYLKIAEASEIGHAAMLRAKASLEARKKIAEGARDSEVALTQAILEKNAAEAASKGAERVMELRGEVDAAEKLAKAEALGPRAAAQQALNNRIAEATRNARAHREATNDPAKKARFDQEIRDTDTLLRKEERVNELREANRALNGQSNQMSDLRAEAELVGTRADHQARELAALKARQEIRNAGRDEGTAESQRYIEQARQIADAERGLKQMKDSYAEIENFGVRTFDRIGAAVTEAFATGKAVEFKNILKAMASEAAQLALRMALINPAMNALFGSSLPTFAAMAGGSSGFFGGSAGYTGPNGMNPGAGVGGNGGSMSWSSIGMKGAEYALGSSPVSAGLKWAFGPSSYSGGGYNLSSVTNVMDGGQAMTGFSTLDSALNAPVWGSSLTDATNTALGSMNGAYGPATSADLASAGLGPSYGAVAGNALGIVAGGYNMYAGFKRGGIGGYTQAAGGAVGVATGASALLAYAGIGAALGPVGWIAAAALVVAGLLLPGQTPSNKEGNFQRDLETGAFVYGGQTGGKMSYANRDAAMKINDQVVEVIDNFEKALDLPNLPGKLKVGLGDRDGMYSEFTDARTGVVQKGFYDRDEESVTRMLTEMTRAALQANVGMLPGDIRQALPNVDFSTLETALKDLSFAKEWRGTLDRMQGTSGNSRAEVDQIRGEVAQLTNGLREFRETTGRLGLDVNAATDAIATMLRQSIGLDLRLEQTSALQKALGLVDERFKALTPTLEEFGISAGEIAVAVNRAKDALVVQVANAFDSTLRQVTGSAYVDNAMGIRNEFETSKLDALQANRDPALMFNARAKVLLDSLDIDQLDHLAAAIRATDTVMADLAAATAVSRRATLQGDIRKEDIYLRRELGGLGYINQAADIRDEWTMLAANDNYRSAGLDPTDLYMARADAMMRGLSADQLRTLADAIRPFDAVMADLAEAAIRLGNAGMTLEEAARTLNPQVGGLLSYARSLRVGDMSPLDARTQYGATLERFNSISSAAASGDAAALGQLQGASQEFLAQSRNVNGSGNAYLADYLAVLASLEQVGNADVDKLTASVMREETRTQTEILTTALAELRAEVAGLRRDQQQAGGAPARVAA